MEQPAEARAGRDAKEDLEVRLAPTPGRATTLELVSSVETLYGAHLRALVERTVAELGLCEVAIHVVDKGALDWVVQARLEAAARQLWPGLPAALPALLPQNDYRVARDRMRRSRLYLPGDQPDLMLNAGLFAPDAVILDLEDSVAPAHKDAARLLVRNALRAVDFRGAERMVRINQLPRGLDDLAALLPHNVHTVLLPKTERAADVLAVVARAEELVPDRPPFVMPILESALGIENAYAIAAAHTAVVALAFGAEDFTRDIGAPRSAAGTESFVARSLVVLAARAAGVQPIDTVYSDVADEDGLLAATREAIALGFEGKGCIHPRQVRVIHEAFRPAAAEVSWAARVQRAMVEAAARGDGVVALGSKMIDPPVVARAQRVLQLAAFYNIDVAAAEVVR